MPSTNAESAIWRPAPVPEAAVDVLVAGGVAPALAPLLARRGATDPDAARAFLEPSLDQLHDPKSLTGIDAAIERLAEARERGERVAIVGDYDVDGVTGTALLVAVLGACGIETEAILPHRVHDGYGFQPHLVDRALETGCGLIVTVDCGTTSVAAAEKAVAVGLDVVVTDHHLPGEARLPDEVVLINPRQDGCGYPFDELSGAGLAFKLALAAAERLGRSFAVERLLRIACLGTIADLVPLVDENRVIAKIGLGELAKTPSPGLQALIQVARIKPPFSTEDVGFRLGPRLNAPGRLDSADHALDLLLARDHARAKELAEQLDTWNRERRDTEKRVVDEALEMVEARESLPPIVVAWSDTWHRGVVGIAAGRLARRLHRPTILLAVDGASATGSGRSLEGVHLHGFLTQWEDELERFGGHAHAIGMTAEVAELERLRPLWEEAAAEDETWMATIARRRHEYELAVDSCDVGDALVDDLARLEPHGQGNSRPLVRVYGPLEVIGTPRLFGRGHLEAMARGEDGGAVRLLGWDWAEKRDRLLGSFEALGFVERDRYDRVGLRLVDVRPFDGTA
ncbi:MAG: single-stranded-DNA-specific exonuclease RecJ [Acidobacteriota bacterium]